MNDKEINTIVQGSDTGLSDAAKLAVEDSMHRVSQDLQSAKMNGTSKTILGKPDDKKNKTKIPVPTDSQIFTNISDMINGSDKDVAGFGTMMESLVMKNKKYYSIIKDYEIMPILIPQINRVLMFLVNECLSPDIQNDATFMIKFKPDEDPNSIQKNIDEIKKEMKLDNLLRDVYTNRFKLGHEFYLMQDYQETFDHMMEQLRKKQGLTETSDMTDLAYLDSIYEDLNETVNECSCTIRTTTISEEESKSNLDENAEKINIEECDLTLNFKDMNIRIERSALCEMVEEAHGYLLMESYSRYSMKNVMNRIGQSGTLNEAINDFSKMEQLVSELKKKKLQRCMLERLDPAKVFKLKIGGRTIGYFVINDILDNNNNTVNFAQSLKDQLLKSRAANMTQTTKTAEEVISKALSEKIITAFDPNIGINRIEDIDLLHDFIRNNEVYKGNKRLTFYYEDEIFDLSRADDSILTNGVFFTKLYATLLLNNIMTKVLRGRGRQIHTVHMGASPNVQRYIQNAMASLTMPENNLGTLHGSFEQILNPFNASSDIIIPTEEDDRKYIDTDYIPGQDVNMDDDFLRTLLNAIVSSFGLDSAVIDATTGNIQFARTLSMESLQICNMVRNEQQDLHDTWESMCLEILRIMGTDATRTAVEQDQIEVTFFEPKSLIMQTIIDDMNNAKQFAENIADIIPTFDNDNTEMQRTKFIYAMIKHQVNIDWKEIEERVKECGISIIGDDIEKDIDTIIKEYKENINVKQFGDTNGDGIVTEEDEELSPEEQDIMNTNLDNDDEDFNI